MAKKIKCSFCSRTFPEKDRSFKISYITVPAKEPNRLLTFAGRRVTKTILCVYCKTRVLYWSQALKDTRSRKRVQPEYLHPIMTKLYKPQQTVRMKKELITALTQVQPVCSTCQRQLQINYNVVFATMHEMDPPAITAPKQCSPCSLALNRLTED